MRDFCFVHAADLHLGSPFAGLSAENSEVADVADAATFAAFDNILQLAISREALFVLLCGDSFDAEAPHLGAQLHFRNGLWKLHDAGISTFIIRGNHDHLGSRQAKLELPPTCHLLENGATQTVCLDGQPIAAISGYSFPQRAVNENVLHFFQDQNEHAALFRVAMLHCNVGGESEHDNYAPCSLEELKAKPYDYWALGHVHQQKILAASHPAVVYPGTPQGLSSRETGVHGCFLVRVDAERTPSLEFIPTDSLRRYNLNFSISGLEGEDELLTALESELASLSENDRSVIVRLTLTGRGPLHAALRDQTDCDEIRNDLNRRLKNQNFVWLDRIQVQTQPDLDLESRRGQDDFAGEFLKLSRAARDEDSAALLASLDDLFAHRDLKNVLPDTQEKFAEWLQQAEWRGADLLTRGEAE